MGNHDNPRCWIPDSRICIGLLVVALLSVVPYGSADDASNAPPAAALTWVREGNALFDAGKYDDAIKKYLLAISVAPNWHEPHYELAQTYYQLKRNDEANTEYAAAIERDPKCWLCYQGLGNLADDEGNRELALQNYQKAVELGPDQAQPRYNLAITYVRLKRIDDAITALKEAERLKPGYASPYFLLEESITTKADCTLRSISSSKPRNWKRPVLDSTRQRSL